MINKIIKKFRYNKMTKSIFLSYLKMNNIKYYKFNIKKKYEYYNDDRNRMYLVYTYADIALLVAFKNEDLVAVSMYEYKSDIFKNIKKAYGDRKMTKEELICLTKLIGYDAEEEDIIP